MEEDKRGEVKKQIRKGKSSKMGKIRHSKKRGEREVRKKEKVQTMERGTDGR